MLFTTCLVFFFICCLAVVNAQTTPVRLPVVSVKGIFKKAFLEDALSPSDIERDHPHTLIDVLKNIRGVSFSQSGSIGSLTTLFLRGGNPNHTLVVSNGMRIMDPTVPDGAFNFGGLLAPDYTSIHVHKGPLSSLYGSDAITGVIQQDLVKGTQTPYVSLKTEHGTFDTHKTTLTTLGSYGRAHYHIFGSALRTQGFVTTPIAYRTNTRQFLTDSVSLATLQGRFDADVSQNTTVTFNTGMNTQRSDYPMSLTPQNPFWTGRSQSRQIVATLVNQKAFRENISLKHKLILGHFGIIRSYTNDNPPFLATGQSRHKGQSLQMSGQQEIICTTSQMQTLKLMSELEYQERAMRSYDVGKNHVLTTRAREQECGFMMAPSLERQLPYDQRITLKTAFRIDNHNKIGTTKTVMGGGEYKLPTQTTLSFYYGTAYKNPTLYQLYGKSAFYQANPTLRPEKGHGFQYGIGQMFTKKIKAEVVSFFNTTKGLLQQNQTSSGLWTYTNINRTKISGVESSLMVMLSKWIFKVSHTYLHTQDVTTGKGLLRRPKNILNMSLGYASTMIDAGLSLFYKGRSFDAHPKNWRTIVNSHSNQSFDGYFTYHLNQRIDFFARLENILDRRQQEDPLGYLRPGFAIYGGIKMTIM